MSENAKRAYVGILGALGLIAILVAALTHVYPVTIGVIIALAFWIASGILARYWGLKKGKS